MTFANATAKCDFEYGGWLGDLQAYGAAAAAAAADAEDQDKAGGLLSC